MRVRWEGLRVSEGVYDPRVKMLAYLEFDKSLSGSYQLLKSTEFASLAQLDSNDQHNATFKSNTPPSHVVLPTVKKLAQGDATSL
jgi:hypothetical protein